MFHVKWPKQVLYIFFISLLLAWRHLYQQSASYYDIQLPLPQQVAHCTWPSLIYLPHRLPWLCGGWVAQIRLTLWPSDRCFPYLYANLWDSLSCLASSIAAWQLLARSAPWDRNACSSHVATSMPLVRLFSCRANRGRDTMGLRCCCTVSNFQQSTSIQTSPPRSVISEFSV